ncbi:MAG: M48 family metalloprotease [Chromatiales bacterium]
MTISLRALAPLLLGSVLALGGCATNPVSHRPEFVLMSENQELAIGRKMHAQVLKEYGQYPDPELQTYVQQVGEELASASDRPQLIYRFTVLDSAEVNAFALPGGYIYITRGILAYMNSEAELASVLGHEIGHVTARHAVRQYTAAQAASIGASIGSIFLPELRTFGGGQLVNLLGTAFLRGYGREHELEADGLGARYMARNGYDATAMLDVLGTLKNQEVFESVLAKQEGREPRVYHGIFSTHPDSDARLKEVVGAARALQTGGADRRDRERYLSHIDGMVVGDSAREGFVRGQDFFHPDLGFGLRFPDGWTVKNRPDRVLFIAPQGKALLQMSAEDLNKRMPPRQFMIDRMGLSKLSHEGRLSPAGLEGHTAVAPARNPKGVREARFCVIYFNNKAYIFAGLVEDRESITVFDTAFLDTARSFHPLAAAERSELTPLHLRVTQAQSGTTFASLAHTSPYPTNAEERLRLLNGRFPSGEIQPGEKIKVVE